MFKKIWSARNNVMKYSGVAFAVLFIFPVFLFAEFKPFKVQEDSVKKTLYVNNLADNASDTNPGTEKQPFKTIGKAMELAMQNKKQNTGTRVVVYPGVYRESLILGPDVKADADPGAGDTDAVLIIEAKEKGSVILSGSDVWDGWKRDGNTNIYTRQWQYKWGIVPNPWPEYNVVMDPICRRREIVFLDGYPMRQVLDKKELNEGKFYVSEEEETLFICLPSGKKIEDADIEVGVRDTVFAARGLKNIVVRGIQFQRIANVVHQGGTGFLKCKNVILEDCSFIWSNWHSMIIHMCDNVIIRRCIANHNGGGNAINFCRNTLLEDTETSYNNWRGGWGEFYGWDNGGIKAMYNHNLTFRNHRAIGNLCGALWFDTDSEDILLENCFWSKNYNGLAFENNQGPIIIRDCISSFNVFDGINIDKSANGILENSIIYGNEASQIYVGGPELAVFKNWDTGKELSIKCSNWVFKNNVIASTDGSVIQIVVANNYLAEVVRSPLVLSPKWGHFLATLTSTGNLWYHKDIGRAFKIEDLSVRDDKIGLSFDGWRALTWQDMDSIVAEPLFISPETYDFRFLPNSPVLHKNSWKKASQEELEAIAGNFPAATKQFRQKLYELRHPEGEAERIKQEADMLKKQEWNTPYPSAKDVPADAWQPLDIASFANRPLTGQDAWIGGYALTQITPGEKIFHGIPFNVINESSNNGFAAIALRSAKISSTLGKDVPKEVIIPLSQKIKAAYFLHGCGWVMGHEKIGDYEIIYDDGTKSVIPIVTYGKEPDNPRDAEKARLESNIQDWWTTAKQFTNENARYLKLGDFYLYTLQWVNPSPDKKIKELRFLSDGKKDASPLILAVTVERRKE
ncbi:MAG: right-handed parallel beta-helix repeat-containing protein [Candidatus Omnitrophica bacterium]|nr:right-handed parallel beta-helix repeat-containing protein [Candidatus Omnitrophota bacterium]